MSTPHPAWLDRLALDLNGLRVHAAVTVCCTDRGQHTRAPLARAVRITVTPGFDPRRHGLPAWLGTGVIAQLCANPDEPKWRVIPSELSDDARRAGTVDRGHDLATRHAEPSLTTPGATEPGWGDTTPHTAWRLWCRICRRDVPLTADNLARLLDAAEQIGGTVDVSHLP